LCVQCHAARHKKGKSGPPEESRAQR
jgi:hypothetical protein